MAARTVVVTSVDMKRVLVIFDDDNNAATGDAGYRAIFSDGSDQGRVWRKTVTSVTPDEATTDAQAKTALERVLGYAIRQAKNQEQLP